MNKRIIELDYVRAVSMLAVVTLHVTGAFVLGDSRLTLFGMNPAFILNQLMRFAVPTFILLSGVSLGRGKSDIPPLEFYRGRLFKVALPYLVWYSVYYIYNVYFAGFKGSSASYFLGILTGAAAPHLYFTVVVIQLYILFPALSRLIKKHRNVTLLVCFAITFYFQQGIYLKCFGAHVLPHTLEPYTWLLFPTWLFYFAAGMAISRDSLSKLSETGKRLVPLLIPAVLIFGFMYALESKLTGSYELSIKPQLFLYTALTFFTLMGLGAACKKFTFINSCASFLSTHSMTIYFLHVLILSIFRKHGIFQMGLSGMLLLLFSVTVLSIILAVLIDGIIGALKQLFKKERVPLTR